MQMTSMLKFKPEQQRISKKSKPDSKRYPNMDYKTQTMFGFWKARGYWQKIPAFLIHFWTAKA